MSLAQAADGARSKSFYGAVQRISDAQERNSECCQRKQPSCPAFEPAMLKELRRAGACARRRCCSFAAPCSLCTPSVDRAVTEPQGVARARRPRAARPFRELGRLSRSAHGCWRESASIFQYTQRRDRPNAVGEGELGMEGRSGEGGKRLKGCTDEALFVVEGEERRRRQCDEMMRVGEGERRACGHRGG